MIKLTKTKATQWLGNGFGNYTAEWNIKGNENISIRKIGGNWVAFEENKRIAKAWNKTDLLIKLENLINKTKG